MSGMKFWNPTSWRRSDGGAAQRRRNIRFPMVLDVQVRCGDAWYSASVEDISRDGVRLRSTMVPAVGRVVAVKYDGPLPTSGHTTYHERTWTGRVAWIRKNSGRNDWSMGLQAGDSELLQRQSWVRGMAETKGGNRAARPDARRDIRYRAWLTVRLLIDGRSVDGIAVDLSRNGMLLKVRRGLPAASQVPVVVGPYGQSGLLRGTAKLVRRTVDAEGAHCYGLSFEPHDASDKATLNAFLDNLRLEAEGRTRL